jgi:energy-coupling factor transport system ATP-binding protein
VSILGQDTADPACDLTALRRRVALVFQNPEHQLLERYVGDDVAYGPRQMGLTGEELRARVRWALEVVGLDMDLFVDRLTFSLSGGETRRVALAGALALRPDILVLDEATTGLDPRGKAEVHALLRRISHDEGLTVLMISNDMDEVAALADEVTVLNAGRTTWAGATRATLAAELPLADWGLAPPTATQIAARLAPLGLCARRDVLTVDEAEEAIWQAMTR